MRQAEGPKMSKHLTANDLPVAGPDCGDFPVRFVPDGMRVARTWNGGRALVPATFRGKPTVPWTNGTVIEDANTRRALPVTTVDQSVLFVDPS